MGFGANRDLKSNARFKEEDRWEQNRFQEETEAYCHLGSAGSCFNLSYLSAVLVPDSALDDCNITCFICAGG